MSAGEGVARPGEMAKHIVEAEPRQELEAGEAMPGDAAGDLQERQRIARALQPDEGDALPTRFREEFEDRRGDDAERPLGADEKVLEVVVGVVLAERPEAVPYLAGSEHHLDAEHQLARIAISEDRRAAGIGREIAADLAGTLRSERQRKEPVDRIGGGLGVGENHPGFGDQRVANRIDGADAIESRQ